MDNKNLKLSKRLNLCADFIREDSKLADIGTDHAYLPIYLLLKNKVKTAVACDINQGPLDSAEANAVRFGLENKLVLKLSDGLEKVNEDEADDIVIAGMGAELILRIIMETSWVFSGKKHLVLQPMTKAEILREELAKNGFEIKAEKAVFEDGKVYSVMSVFFTGEKSICAELERFMGKIIPSDEFSDLYAQKVIRSLNKKLVGCELKGKHLQAEKIKETISEIENTYLCGGN